MDAIFEFLFKYRPLVFEEGDLTFRPTAMTYLATVAVVAKSDAKWGETPCAFIELKPGQEVSEAEILAHCRSNLAHFKLPRHVVFGPVPKTSTGKIQKFHLRERAEEI